MSVSAATTEGSAPGSAARRFASAAGRDLPLVAMLAAFVAEPSTRDFALVNLAVQAVMFAFGACLPAYRTRVMAVADCAWPWGLVAIGVQALLFCDTRSPGLLIVGRLFLVVRRRLRGGGRFSPGAE